jgi:hypothetical protein
MFASRWRNPCIPAYEALLLLPRLPDCAIIWRDRSRWSSALESLGIAEYEKHSSSEATCCVAIAPAGKAAASGFDLVLIDGRDWARRLERAGYNVRTYVARRDFAGVVSIECLKSRDSLHDAFYGNAPQSPRKLLVRGVRRLTGRHYITIGRRGTLTPAAVSAVAGSMETALLLAGGGGERRRSTFLVARDRISEPDTAVKVGPIGWRTRGMKEQLVLRQLQEIGLANEVPKPLGEGAFDRICWSAETAVRGRPLSDLAFRPTHREEITAVLERLAAWFTRLAITTRTSRVWATSESALSLRGEHSRLGAIRAALASSVPGVLVHGDVGTGVNVLLDGCSFSIIDWETATAGELPFTDVLPLICNALAALNGCKETASIAEYVLRLCAGREADSAWLLRLLHSYCSQAGVPLDQAGALAALAWGYQASMRLVHDELVVQAGGAPVGWRSPADDIARNWLSYPDLGTTWPALTGGRKT